MSVHKHLTSQIQSDIVKSEIDGGVWLGEPPEPDPLCENCECSGYLHIKGISEIKKKCSGCENCPGWKPGPTPPREQTFPVGKTLLVQTKNTLYRIEKRGEKEFYISGSARFCPVPTRASIHGSTWGGAMLKCGFVGRGMHLEFSINGDTIGTSEIIDVREEGASSSG